MQGVLLSLGERDELGAPGFRALLESALSISSDAYCSTLLPALAARLPRDDATLAYDRAVATLGSDSYRRCALDALD